MSDIPVLGGRPAGRRASGYAGDGPAERRGSGSSSRRDPRREHVHVPPELAERACLFIGKLGPSGIETSELRQLYSNPAFGEILYLSNRRGFAFVQLDSIEGAQRAIRQTNDVEVSNGQRIEVSLSHRGAASGGKRKPPDSYGLPPPSRSSSRGGRPDPPHVSDHRGGYAPRGEEARGGGGGDGWGHSDGRDPKRPRLSEPRHSSRDPLRPPPAAAPAGGEQDPELEVIALNGGVCRDFGLHIMGRVEREIGLRVSVMVLPPKLAVGDVLADLRYDGIPYAVVISPDHERTRTADLRVTVRDVQRPLDDLPIDELLDIVRDEHARATGAVPPSSSLAGGRLPPPAAAAAADEAAAVTAAPDSSAAAAASAAAELQANILKILQQAQASGVVVQPPAAAPAPAPHQHQQHLQQQPPHVLPPPTQPARSYYPASAAPPPTNGSNNQYLQAHVPPQGSPSYSPPLPQQSPPMHSHSQPSHDHHHHQQSQQQHHQQPSYPGPRQQQAPPPKDVNASISSALDSLIQSARSNPAFWKDTLSSSGGASSLKQQSSAGAAQQRSGF